MLHGRKRFVERAQVAGRARKRDATRARRRLYCEQLERRRLFSAGALDTTFDGDGKLTTQVAAVALNDQANSVAFQQDGKIVVAGSSDNGSRSEGSPGFAVVRYNVDGSLDTSFDGDGKLTTRIGSASVARGVAIQADGKIVVAGFSASNIDAGDPWHFALARYNSDGSLDTTFDSDGIVTTPIGNSDAARGLVVQSDGKIVVAGESYNGTYVSFALARFNPDGSLDASFGSGGRVTTRFGSVNDYAYSLAIQADEKIVVAGRSYDVSDHSDFALARYNSDGSLDTTFDGDGKVTTPIGSSHDFAYSVAIQSNAKIVVAGSSWNLSVSSADFAIARYDADGSLDTTFDGDGKLTTDFGSNQDVAYAVAIEGDGKIVVGGEANPGFGLARYNADGSLDTDFGINGRITTTFGFVSHANSVVIQTDGKIVAAGVSFDIGSGNVFALARYDVHPPTTSGIGDVTVNENAPNTLIDLFAAFADATDPDSSLAYTITGDTNPALFDSMFVDSQTGTLTLAYLPDSYGAATLTVRATDRSGQFAETSFNVVVNPLTPGFDFTAGVLTIIGTSEADRIKLKRAGSGLRVISNFGTFSVPQGESVVTVIVRARAGNDNVKLSVLGEGQTAEVYGGDGDDWIAGGSGDDILLGGLGNDTLNGATGDDFQIGGSGSDFLIASTGNDILVSAELNDPLHQIDLRLVLDSWLAASTQAARQAVSQELVGIVLNDLVSDTLTGGTGINLFVRSALDTIRRAGLEDLLVTV